jgi:nicotinamidase-related amidase
MPLTALDPVTALIVIDMQKGVAGLPTAHPLNEVLMRIRELIAAFRARDLPVVLVNVVGRPQGRTEQGSRTGQALAADWTVLLPELEQHSNDILITKRSWGAFSTTDLEARLKANQVTQVVIVGVSTSVGVEATARQAYEQGLNVTLALDAMTDVSHEAHEHSVRNIFPRLGETGATQDIVSLLEKREPLA